MRDIYLNEDEKQQDIDQIKKRIGFVVDCLNRLLLVTSVSLIQSGSDVTNKGEEGIKGEIHPRFYELGKWLMKLEENQLIIHMER